MREIIGKRNRELLVERVRNIPLYLHAYALHLNMRYERILPRNFLDITHQQKLGGTKIYAEDGGSRSLQKLNDQQLHDFKEKAKKYNLDVYIETSVSDKATLMDAIRIAVATGATSVCFHPRYEGHLDDVMAKIVNDIVWLPQYDDCGLSPTVKRYEDLWGHELATLVNNSGMRDLSIPFDFGNMIDANERPFSTLEIMSPPITRVYVKDAKIIREDKGWGHEARHPEYGGLLMEEMLEALLLLGEDKPQVHAFGLKEEVEYYAPAFRFDSEDDNPWILWRDASYTPLPDSNMIDTRLAQEKEYAPTRIKYIRGICDKSIGSQLVFLKYYQMRKGL